MGISKTVVNRMLSEIITIAIASIFFWLWLYLPKIYASVHVVVSIVMGVILLNPINLITAFRTRTAIPNPNWNIKSTNNKIRVLGIGEIFDYEEEVTKYTELG